ncbi:MULTISPECIES: hypothetical protein [Streptomyces]|uniref:hypothetical protein n=1 Tax=Streptomyces TaxID=1883 RepID=UPI000B41FF89|nr:hypothetical protein [Streptomyces sp. CS159]OWA07787.1 hypothetical protein B9W64_27115 [Streptomyces sp. CS159]
MSESERAPYSAAAWGIGWGVFLVSGFAASVLLSNAWHDCDTGVNASANLGSLVLASTSMAAASTLLWALTRRVTGRRRLLWPLLLTTAGAAVLLWPLMALWHAPDGYPVTFCPPDNVPRWWPAWLPV